MKTFDEESRLRGVETKQKMTTAINFRSKGVRRRRKPGDVPDKATAIVSACRECMGYESGPGEGSLAGTIQQCTTLECWLWPWRTGKLDESLWK